ncbi:GNAT family N-acetyltransferase [Halobacillus naozhouensis]|uniref:GNAT family N-acetyltransferase n=1 Tax=Halobacillus naozhouensis TaxID=554880 RepID=A0ABY8IZA7_9BACI|nr:GNAT family N-acetyltransferase [Halobacillus naozhouensis]WFT74528.1 GNAT family N-acetyltransferase [Halobacillus naozhouensis]
MMRVEETADASGFARQAEPLLLQKEAENNLPLGIIGSWKNSGGKDSSAFMLTVYDGEEPVYVTLRTPPHLWILPAISTINQEVLTHLARFLYENEYEVPGVLGESEAVQWFVEAWEQCSGQEGALHMKQGIYRLDQLKPVVKKDGELILAEQKDYPLLVRWLTSYGHETGEVFHKERVAQLAGDMISDQKMHLWQVNRTIVSMVCRARTTPNGATVNAVFTPDEYKRRGYATQAVASLTEKLLTEGYEFCALYTDLANATSNTIYKKIGYNFVGQSLVYHFSSSS